MALTPLTKTSPPSPPPYRNPSVQKPFNRYATLSLRTQSKQWYGDLLAKAVCY